MALRSLTGPMFYPAVLPLASTVATFTIDAAGEKVAFAFHAPKAGTLARVGFLLGTVTTGADLKVSLQDPELVTGNPDGVVDQFRVVPVADTDDNAWKYTGLITSDGTDGGAKRTVVKGERLCVVIEFDSAVGWLAVATQNINFPFPHSAYVNHFTAAWAKAANPPSFWLEYDDGSGAPIAGVIPGTGAQINQTDTGTDEVGIRFTVPWRCEVDGGWAYSNAVIVTSTFVLKLYDANLNVLRSVEPPPAYTIMGSAQRAGEWAFSDGSITLEPGVVYYFTQRVTGTQVGLRYLQAAASPGIALWDQFDGGRAVYWVQRLNDTGAFTEDTLRRPMMGLRISSLEDGAQPVVPAILTPAPGIPTISGGAAYVPTISG